MKSLIVGLALWLSWNGWAYACLKCDEQEFLMLERSRKAVEEMKANTEQIKRLTDQWLDSQSIKIKLGLGGGIGMGDQSKYSTAMMFKLSAERGRLGVEAGGQFNHVYTSQIRTYYDPTKGQTFPLSLPEIGERYNVYFIGPYFKYGPRWWGPRPFVKLSPNLVVIKGEGRDISALGVYYGVGLEGMSDSRGSFVEFEIGQRHALVTRGDEYQFVEFMLSLGRKF